ncbi:uncharacterized protein LY79DRAFT_261022 [Colletotrichum navitas]|uniref:Uncharacterized protein n=1 Tax=Colletotrichum navitas TaxID=681940 RepID=A0AAD8PXC3_9PEZI|nr:uncharacterized protein LY79DRAFT_261022 [Colletotrichum navitas]KAK1585811.1 hypothetical protein LY79DRAFT_261022 [Colletotrichum navitas]
MVVVSGNMNGDEEEEEEEEESLVIHRRIARGRGLPTHHECWGATLEPTRITCHSLILIRSLSALNDRSVLVPCGGPQARVELPCLLPKGRAREGWASGRPSLSQTLTGAEVVTIPPGRCFSDTAYFADVAGVLLCSVSPVKSLLSLSLSRARFWTGKRGWLVMPRRTCWAPKKRPPGMKRLARDV